jgi:hypothetical protein
MERWAVLSLVMVIVAVPVRADSTAHNVADFLSGPGNLIYLSAGVFEPILLHQPDGKRHSLRILDSLATATAGSEILKLVTHESRPDDPHSHDSFPSGHATAAFAVASSLTEYYPRQAPYWYVGAAAIGWSRVELRRHHTIDVLAGSGLGYWVGKLEVRSRHGLMLGPVYSAAGVGLGVNWKHGL